jgi:hypothetical protein
MLRIIENPTLDLMNNLPQCCTGVVRRFGTACISLTASEKSEIDLQQELNKSQTIETLNSLKGIGTYEVTAECVISPKNTQDDELSPKSSQDIKLRSQQAPGVRNNKPNKQPRH